MYKKIMTLIGSLFVAGQIVAQVDSLRVCPPPVVTGRVLSYETDNEN